MGVVNIQIRIPLQLSTDLRSYLSGQPFISSMMNKPLYCSVVTELYIQYWQGERRRALLQTV